jgi:hypothetical protein
MGIPRGPVCYPAGRVSPIIVPRFLADCWQSTPTDGHRVDLGGNQLGRQFTDLLLPRTYPAVCRRD